MKDSGTPPVQIKATRDGFSLLPDPVAPFQTIANYMMQRLTDSHHFFKRARMTLNLRNRPFRADEITELRQLLKDKADVELADVSLGSDMNGLLNWASQQLGVRLGIDRADHPEPRPVVVRTTCRSGMRVESDGDCIVLGDVNPGAEILAVGDIIVFGRLRGIAHAGAMENRNARIWALSIEPNQIRIADLMAVPPRESRRESGRFEMAEVRGESIHVTTL